MFGFPVVSGGPGGMPVVSGAFAFTIVAVGVFGLLTVGPEFAERLAYRSGSIELHKTPSAPFTHFGWLHWGAPEFLWTTDKQSQESPECPSVVALSSPRYGESSTSVWTRVPVLEAG